MRLIRGCVLLPLCPSPSSFGGYIDEFDVVMRINGAPTAGFEAQVGSRTTHRFVNNAYVGWREGSEKLVSKWSGRCGVWCPCDSAVVSLAGSA